MPNTSRRQFLKTTAAAASGVTLGIRPSATRMKRNRVSANDRIGMGFIGVGNRGTQLLHRFMENRDVDVVALCDVYQPYLNRQDSAVHASIHDQLGGRVPRMDETLPDGVKRYTDFRNLLEDPDVDGVCIATPDHWHAVQGIMAMEAEKDIYIEKPLTITLHEGRRLVEAQERTGRVAQVGLNRRGSPVFQSLAQKVQEGLVGPVSVARAYRISNMYPDGIGRETETVPPPGLDWDMWLGPRPLRPYQANITPYKFRWWKSYSTQMGNWGVHYMDVIRWLLGEKAPVAISAHGSHRLVNDDRTIPDTMEVTFELGSGAVINFGIYEACGGPGVPNGAIELRGGAGTLYAGERGYTIEPARPGQFQDWDALVEPQEVSRENPGDSTSHLIRNFLDCMASRETPLCTLEEGHRSTSFAHLANMALEAGRRLEWDAEAERVTNVEEANALLHYTYRKPWKLS